MQLSDFDEIAEELQRLLKNEMDVRKQVEGDIFKIKKGLEEQVNKEKSQRDEISKQLQIMKGESKVKQNVLCKPPTVYCKPNLPKQTRAALVIFFLII